MQQPSKIYITDFDNNKYIYYSITSQPPFKCDETKSGCSMLPWKAAEKDEEIQEMAVSLAAAKDTSAVLQ